MKKTTQQIRGFRAGFSLVEVTLALLVVAIGLTATFALFPVGLKATRDAVDDTEIALFAEYVFTTLDLTAGKYGGNYGIGWNIQNTDNFLSLMLNAGAPANEIELQDGGVVSQFKWYPDYYGLNAGNYASANFSDFWTSAFTYTLDLSVSSWKGYGSGVTTYALLKVWPGEHQGADEDARIFYREILPLR